MGWTSKPIREAIVRAFHEEGLSYQETAAVVGGSRLSKNL